MSSRLTTSSLFPGRGIDGQPLPANVIGAEATATTYVLNCYWGGPDYDPGLDDDFVSDTDCGIFNNTITLGPWASKTLPPGAAATGDFDYFITMNDQDDPWRFSVHCEMSQTVAKACTPININKNNYKTPTATFTASLDLAHKDFISKLYYNKIIITSRQELPEAIKTGKAADDSKSTS